MTTTEIPDPTMPRVREDTYTDVETYGFLHLDDAPEALASLDSALRPLLKMRQDLAIAIEQAEQQHLASVAWRVGGLAFEKLNLLNVHFAVAPLVPDEEKFRLGGGIFKLGKEPLGVPGRDDRPPQPGKGGGSDDPGGGQAADIIECPHCRRKLQLLKAPGSY